MMKGIIIKVLINHISVLILRSNNNIIITNYYLTECQDSQIIDLEVPSSEGSLIYHVFTMSVLKYKLILSIYL